MPVMEIAPQYRIYEGDRLSITCTISKSLYSSQSIHLYLSQGTRLLSHGDTRVNHSMEALAKDPGEFECKLEMGNVVKVAKKTISVTGELTDEGLCFPHCISTLFILYVFIIIGVNCNIYFLEVSSDALVRVVLWGTLASLVAKTKPVMLTAIHSLIQPSHLFIGLSSTP